MVEQYQNSGNNTDYLVIIYVDVEGRSAQLGGSVVRLVAVVQVLFFQVTACPAPVMMCMAKLSQTQPGTALAAVDVTGPEG